MEANNQHSINALNKASLKHDFLGRTENYITDIHPQQRQYAEYFINTLLDTNTDNRPVVISSRCGIGKSQCVQAFCDSLAHIGLHDVGVIIVTDSLERLKNLYNGEIIDNDWGKQKNYFKQDSIYISSESDLTPKEQLINAKYKQFVFLTTQRMKDLSEYELQELLIYQYKGKKYKRMFMIYDERPIAYEVVPISRKEINDISTALAEGIPTSEDNRTFVIKSYETLRQMIVDDFLKLDIQAQTKLKSTTNRDYFVKHFNMKTLTTNDDLFFSVLETYKKNINSNKRLQSKSYEMLHYLKDIVEKGVIVQANKSTRATIDDCDYDLSMYYLKNNMMCLTQDIKTFVLDATADIEPIYLHDGFKMADTLSFEPLKPLRVVNINTSINRDRLNDSAKDIDKRTKNIEFLNALSEDVQKQLDGEAGLVICYKDREQYFMQSDNDECVQHFGNVRGLNKWYQLDNVVQLGLNRQSGFDYLMNFYFINRQLYDELLKLDEESSRKEIEKMTANEFGVFQNSAIDSICMQRAIADLEQNLFRCSLRDFNSTIPVTLYLYCHGKYMERIGGYLQYKWNAEIEIKTSEKLNSFVSRTKKTSIAGRIMQYINSIPDDTEFRINDILNNCNISKEQFKSSKKHNSELTAILKKYSNGVGKFKKL